MARSPRTYRAQQEVKLVDLVLQARELRGRGLTYEAIGKIQGCGRRTAERRVKRCLNKQLDDSAEETRKLELGRLDRMLEGLCSEPMYDDKGRLLSGGAFGGEPQSVIAALKIVERRCKLLGLDKPEVKDVRLTTKSTPAEARAVMRELFGGSVGPLDDGADVGAHDGDSVQDPQPVGNPSAAVPPPGAATH